MDEIRAHEGYELLRIAESYHLPVPDVNDDETWTRGEKSPSAFLTNAGYSKIRTAIREEQKQRADASLRWVPVLSSLTGLGGVVVAILSLLKK